MAIFPGPKAFKSDRIKSWQKIAGLIPELSKDIDRHIRDIAKLSKLTGSGGTARTHSPIRKSHRKSPRSVRLCRICKTPLPHPKPEIKQHMYRMHMYAQALKSWKKYPPGSLARRLRMEKAWAGRRKKKNEAIISQTHPRIIKIFGKDQVIGRVRADDIVPGP